MEEISERQQRFFENFTKDLYEEALAKQINKTNVITKPKIIPVYKRWWETPQNLITFKIHTTRDQWAKLDR